MRKIMFLLLVAFLATFMNCDSDDRESTVVLENDYLIFGHFYGLCFGEKCIETYKLTNQKLLEDVKDDYLQEDFEFVELSNEKFEKVKDLVALIPTRLLDEVEEVIGCPGCSDGGGIYIQSSMGSNIKTYRIDMDKNNLPDYLHDFIDLVNEKIQLINDDQLNCDLNTIVNKDLFESLPSDHLVIDSAKIEENCLKISFSSSGCSGDSWDVNLVTSGDVKESDPAQIDLRLSLKNEELCLAVFTKELTFDISNLRISGGKVQLNILNTEYKIIYEY